VLAFDATSGAAEGRRIALLGSYLDSVNTIAATGESLYIGGPAGTSAPPVLRVSAKDGRPQPFHPRIFGRYGGWVDAMVTTPAGLFVAGPFERVGGRRRDGLALLDPTTARVKPWTLPSCKAVEAGDGPARVLIAAEDRIITNCRAFGDGERLVIAQAPAR
jgi:hypothetical protein